MWQQPLFVLCVTMTLNTFYMYFLIADLPLNVGYTVVSSMICQVESAPLWLLERLSCESHEVIIKIASVLWAVWFARNKKIWDVKVMTPSVAMEWNDERCSKRS